MTPKSHNETPRLRADAGRAWASGPAATGTQPNVHCGSATRGALALLAALLVQSAWAAASTNTVPWSDAFESYPNGNSIIGTNGWSAESTNSAVATTAPAVIASLTNYLTTGGSYPLASATHTGVLQAVTLVTNDVRSATGGVVAVEFMALPVPQPSPPPVQTNLHYAFYVNTSSNLVIWHQNRSGGVTNNEWRALTNGPAVSASAWSRFTVVQDFGHSLFRIRVNESTNAVPDPAGWTGPGGTQPGDWFYMVKTNTWMSHVMLGGDATNYVDDLQLTNRCVTWSTNRFVEAQANDGSVDTNTLFTLALAYDTFAGTNGQPLSGTAFAVAGAPVGLTGVLTRVDDTHLSLAFAGQAVSNEAADSVSNIAVTLLDPAFTLGNAADVAGRSNGTVAIGFQNSAGIGTLSLSGTRFGEAAANDGSISNTLALTLGVLTFTNVSPFIAGIHYTVANVPQGLAFSLTRSDATTVVAHVTGTAAAHAAADSITNLTLSFLDAAFPGSSASNVIGSTSALAVDFRDPPQLAYSATNFTEAAANNGTIGNTITMTLAGDTFTNAAFTSGVHFTAPAVPAGLTLVLSRTDAATVTATLTGTAAAHTAASSLASIGFAFLSPAFSTVAAQNIVGSATNLAVTFADPPVLTYLGSAFTEAPANDGTIGNSNAVTLTGTTFTGSDGDILGGTKVVAANVPSGLAATVTRLSATTVSVQLTGVATPNRTANDTTALSLRFLDAAFNTVLATNIVGSLKTNLTVTFDDAASLVYATNVFAELPANDGSVGGGTLTLTGDTFAGNNGDALPASFANLPAGLTATVARSSSTTASIAFSGHALAHAAANSIANLGLTFGDGAFAAGHAAGVANAARSDLGIAFADAPSVSAAGTDFVEAGANNGAIGNSLAITLAGDTFKDEPFVANTHYTVAHLPAGLTFSLSRDSASQVTASLGGNALSHLAADSINNLTVTFLDAAFNAVQAANVTGHPLTFSVTFANQPALTYSTNAFSESSGGVIDNRTPMAISLAGDTFAADAGDHVAVANLPAGLSAAFTRDTPTQLSVRLNGAALAHASADSISNLSFTFLPGAFANADANQVAGYSRADLGVQFIDDVGFFNVIPYRESYEDYSAGLWLAGTNGWTADYYPDAGVIDNDTSVAGNLARYLNTHYALPIVTNHLQTLAVRDSVRVAIHSESAPLVYVDFMVQPVPMQEAPPTSTNVQYAFYVTTNLGLALWHCNRTGGTPTNEWLTLAASPTIDTSRWVRFTVAQDYANHMFQLRVNEGAPIVDAAGWSMPAGTPGGSWFHMVQTNGTMSHFIMSGIGHACLDDLTVQTTLPSTFGQGRGQVFKFR